jgi:transcriptional regulator with XRE-family HTH domain
MATVPEDIKEDIERLHIGKKIRELRVASRLILQDLSDRTGLSKSLISQIESETVSPPIATLIKISKALGVNISYFFQETTSEEPVALIRKAESKVIDSRYFGRDRTGYYYEALAYKKATKSMEPFLVEFRRKKVEKSSFLSHEGEEFVHLMEGSLEFRTEKEVYTLDPGDSLYFDSSTPHAYRSLGKNNAKAIVVVYAKRQTDQ